MMKDKNFKRLVSVIKKKPGSLRKISTVIVMVSRLVRQVWNRLDRIQNLRSKP